MSVLESVQGLRKILSLSHNPPVQKVIDGGAVPHLIRFIELFDFPQVQYEAAWALTNISCGTTQHCKVILEKGAVPHLVKLLESPNQQVKEQAVWVLGNIAGDTSTSRDLILQFGALPRLISVISIAEDPGFIKNCAWAISNLCRGNPSPKYHQIAEALPTMAKLVMTSEDQEVLIDCCWALSHLSVGQKIEHIDAVLETGVHKRIIQLLNHHLATVQIPALRVLGNIINGTEEHATILINQGVLAALSPVLSCPKKELRKEAAWALSNLSTGPSEHISAIFQSGNITKLINMLAHDDAEIKREAIWTICNSSKIAQPHEIGELVQAGVIQAISGLLSQQDSRLLLGAMECLTNILSTGSTHAMDEQGRNSFALFLDQ